MGGGKQAVIDNAPILREYFARFWQDLTTPAACLMIIGYGFRDTHINGLLGKACQANNSLSAFYVDPIGRKVSRGADADLPQYTPPWGFIH